MTIDNYFELSIYLNTFKYFENKCKIPFKIRISSYYKFNDSIDEEIINNLYYHMNVDSQLRVYPYKLQFYQDKQWKRFKFNCFLTKEIHYDQNKESVNINEYFKFKFLMPNKEKYFDDKLIIKIEILTKKHNIENKKELQSVGSEYLIFDTEFIQINKIFQFGINYEKIIFSKNSFLNLDLILIFGVNYSKFNEIQRYLLPISNNKVKKYGKMKNLKDMIKFYLSNKTIDKFYDNYLRTIKINIDKLYFYLKFVLLTILKVNTLKKDLVI